MSSGAERSGAGSDPGPDAATAVLTALALAAAAWAQRPILRSGFWEDDFVHFLDLVDRGTLAFVFEPVGGHFLVLRHIVLAGLYRLFGLTPEPYFVVVMAHHLLNVYLLGLVLRRVTGRPWIAVAGAAWWGTAPVLQGTLAWFAAYGQVFATTFVLLLLARMAAVARRAEGPSHRELALWVGLLVAAAASHALGLAASLVAVALPWLLLSGRHRRRRATLYLLAAATALGGAFVLGGMVATEAVHRVGVLDRLAVFAQLLGFGLAGLVPGLIGASDALAAPLARAGALAWLLATGTLAWLGRRRGGGWILGMALLVVGAYGSIAAGRAGLLLLGWSPAQIGSVLRFHYLALAGLAAWLGLALDLALSRAPGPSFQGARRGPLRAVATPSLLVLLAGLAWTGGRVAPHMVVDRPRVERARSELARAQARIRERIRDAPEGTAVYLPNRDFAPTREVEFFWGYEAFPGWAGVFLVTWSSNTVEGRRVFFVEPRSHLVERLRSRRGERLDHLVLTEEEAARRLVAGG